MRARAVKRPPFDPRYAFVVTPTAGRRDITVSGARLAAGAVLDKNTVDGRRLRQMYEARLISVAPGHAPLPAQPRRLRRAVGPGAAVPPPVVAAPAAPTDPVVDKKPRGVLRRARFSRSA